jgi:capsid portal protein
VGRASINEIEVLVSPTCLRRGDPVEKAFSQVDGQPIDESKPGSQQLPPENITSGIDRFDEIVTPPIDLKLWASQLARNTRLNRGVRIIARNTVGLGWSIVPAKKVTEDTSEKELAEIAAETARVEEFFENLHPMQPFQSLFECVVVDEEATGNGYFEVTRTGDNSLEFMYHVASITMRVLRDGRGYVQIRGGRRKYFKKYGDERVMDAFTGLFSDEEGFGGKDFKSGDAIAVDRRATEVIHFLLYSPLSEFYGLPRFIPAGAAIAGNFHSARRNVAFFQNDAVPRMAVMVSGGALDAESKETVAKLFQEGQGAEQAHRIIVLQTTNEGVGVEEKNTAKIELKPLTVNTTEDGSFLNYRRMNDEEIRESLGLSEVYFKSEKLTKASATVAKSTTDEQEFEPARILKETIINKMIVSSEVGLNAKRVKFRFARSETTDPLERSQVHKNYSEIGALTPNEIRIDLGKDPLPKSEEWAQVPLPIAAMGLKGEITQGSRFAVTPGDPTSATPAEPAEPAEPAAPAAEEEPAAEPEEEAAKEAPDELAFLHPATERLRELPQTLKSCRTGIGVPQ